MTVKKKTLFVLMVIATICSLGFDLACFVQYGFDLNKHAFFVQAIVLAFFTVCVSFMPDDKRKEIDEDDLPTNVVSIKRYLQDVEASEQAERAASIPDHAKMRANTPDGLG